MHIKIRNVYMYMILGDENLFVMGKNQWHCKRIRKGMRFFVLRILYVEGEGEKKKNKMF